MAFSAPNFPRLRRAIGGLRRLSAEIGYPNRLTIMHAWFGALVDVPGQIAVVRHLALLALTDFRVFTLRTYKETLVS